MENKKASKKKVYNFRMEYKCAKCGLKAMGPGPCSKCKYMEFFAMVVPQEIK